MPAQTHPFDLTGRDFWVVGGAGYLGQATVQALAQLGANVLCADLGARAQEFVTTQNLASTVTPATLDARDAAAVTAFAAEQVKARGVPDGLVVMTYGASGKALADLTLADFDAANESNLTATFHLTREVGALMAARGGGSIVLFSSMYGTVSSDPRIYEVPMNPNPIEYGVGKAGLQQMARYLAVHWGSSGVRVNSISPGPFPNPPQQSGHPEFMKRLAQRTPLGRIGQAPEIAGSVAFLLSDASSFVTGHNLAVDGGWTAW
jgi:NAD(P)-dependent dehydrogenase (short-subunit alcohol dehydrogenase family)